METGKLLLFKASARQQAPATPHGDLSFLTVALEMPRTASLHDVMSIILSGMSAAAQEGVDLWDTNQSINMWAGVSTSVDAPLTQHLFF